MTEDPTIREQGYAYFLQEAPELLQVLEQGLLSLRENYSITKIHTLMRATHTLKGAAASMGLESIKTVAHSLEDIFKALYKPDVAIDSELEALLFEGYECLRAPLMAELTGSHANDSEVFASCAAIFTRLQEKLGDCFGQEAYIPTSAELGFDMTQSIFEVGVTERLEQLASVLASGQPQAVASTLQTQAEIFLGLAESLNLPGFGAIAEAAITALTKHPNQAMTIAQAALADFQQGQAAVLAGDRTQGGKPTLALQQLAGGEEALSVAGEEEDLGEIVQDELALEAKDSLLESIWNIPESQASPTDEEALDSPAVEDNDEGKGLSVDDRSRHQKQPSTPTHIPEKDSVPQSHTVRVNVEHLERLNYLIGELLTNQNRQFLQDEQLQGAIQELFSQLRQHQQMLEAMRHSSDRHTELHDLVQSLLENAVQLEKATDIIDLFSRQSSQILEKQDRLLTSVRDDLFSVRMVPLGDIFSRLPRVLRQLETLQGKPVALKVSGSEVLVDKALVQKLYDPLLHLVRNAFDHGIEPIEVRRQQGKAEKGQIEIRVFHQGSHLMIEVRDDGQGLKFDQIRQRAVEGNLVSPEQARNLNEAQLMDLLFEPGFSTVSQVNELSGRGIGLDVVRAHLQALQGSVTVHSEPNRGTTFLLQIPFTLTMAKLLLAQAGPIRQAQGSVPTVYALLSDGIEQIIIPQSDQIRRWEGGKALRWGKGADEQLIPVYNLSFILHYFSSVTEPQSDQPINHNSNACTEQLMRVVILRCQDKLLGLEVEQIIGEQELVIRPLGPMIVPPPYVYGGSILADSRLTLVIDGAALVKYTFDQQSRDSTNEALVSFTPPILSSNLQRHSSSASAPSSLAPQLPTQPYPSLRAMPAETLLVVDDSNTLRQTLALTLQKSGYQVLQARDGYEAIEQLQLQPAIRLVICDIEMPRMNGFEFLNYRQQDSALAEIPVVILTSRSGEKHRLIAKQLGATAYINKPYLEHQLLAIVADLLALPQGIGAS